MDEVKNFAHVIVSTGYAASATSIVLTADHGAKLPAPTVGYSLIWWNYTDYKNPSDDPNVEIVRCTGKSTDTLTVTRAQESTSAATHNTGGKVYHMMLGVTAKVITDIAAILDPITAAGLALMDDATAAAQLVTLGTAAYSEGTWTPVLNGFTVVDAAPAVSGIWKRIGNLMFASCAISAGVGGNTSVACTVNASTISGLPVGTGLQLPCFTIDNWDNNLGIGIVSNTSMFPATFSANVHTINASATYITS